MSQVDWSKAPEGATHYRPEMHHPWYLLDSRGVWFFWTGFLWSQFPMQPRVIERLIERPTSQPAAWNGEGLPPVGTVLELLYSSTCGTYAVVEAVAHHREGVLVYFISTPDGNRDGDYQLECGFNDKISGLPNFRPIRTPEQIAADEREAVIMQMLEDAKRPITSKNISQASLLYDSGWRKMGHSK